MNFTARRERFREVLAGNSCIRPASVFDPISARLAEDIGFEVAMLAGSTASMTVLGNPDLILLTLAELAEQTRRICRAGNLPLLVDADHGYGNALNVMRTVEELETSGVAALTIEDTELPAPFGQTGSPRLISIEEGIGKMRAALRARRDKGFVIVGRTSAPAITSVEDGIERCRRYAGAGVDAVFVVGLQKKADLEALASAIDIPIMLGRVEGELAGLKNLEQHKVKIALQGHQPIMAAIQAIYETMQALRDGTAPSSLARIASADLVSRVTRESTYREWMVEFLGKR